MTAYMIFIRESEVRDPAAMDAYRSGSGGNPNPNIKALAVYGALEAVEGKAPDGVVILQFPTVEDAKAWYHSPEYQKRAPHRRKAAEYRAFIVQGL